MYMNSSSRREDIALVRAWGRSVYVDRARVGAVHPGDGGWIAESADGRVVGVFRDERIAVGAVLSAARRR